MTGRHGQIINLCGTLCMDACLFLWLRAAPIWLLV